MAEPLKEPLSKKGYGNKGNARPRHALAEVEGETDAQAMRWVLEKPASKDHTPKQVKMRRIMNRDEERFLVRLHRLERENKKERAEPAICSGAGVGGKEAEGSIREIPNTRDEGSERIKALCRQLLGVGDEQGDVRGVVEVGQGPAVERVQGGSGQDGGLRLGLLDREEGGR